MQFNALVLGMHPYVADQMFAEREGIFGKRLVAGAFYAMSVSSLPIARKWRTPCARRAVGADRPRCSCSM